MGIELGFEHSDDHASEEVTLPECVGDGVLLAGVDLGDD